MLFDQIFFFTNIITLHSSDYEISIFNALTGYFIEFATSKKISELFALYNLSLYRSV